MNCPHCGEQIELEWQRTKKRRRAKGQCVDCGKPAGLSPHTGKPFWRCTECRRAIAVSATATQSHAIQ